MSSFSEYSKIRNIVRKRNERLVQKGLAEKIHFPTVNEIKSGKVSSEVAFRYVHNYYTSGSSVSEFKKNASLPIIDPIEKFAKKVKKSKRKYSQERQFDYVDKHSKNEKESTTHIAYLKALKTIKAKFEQHGRYLDLDLQTMSPSETQDFVEYMDYRFSQGDFSKKYVIIDFVRDYEKARAQGYTTDQLKKDFEKFVIDRMGVKKEAKSIKQMSTGKFTRLWKDFFKKDVGMGLTIE